MLFRSLGDLGGGLEIEGLFGGEAVEEDLLDGGLAAPARGREMRDGTELGDGSADLRMPSRRIFVLARSSPLGSVGRERAVAMAGARGGKRGRGRRGMTRTAGSARETRCAREQTRRGRARGWDRGAGNRREDGRGGWLGTIAELEGDRRTSRLGTGRISRGRGGSWRPPGSDAFVLRLHSSMFPHTA